MQKNDQSFVKQDALPRDSRYDILTTYLTRPKLWPLYTFITLIVVLLINWSGSTVAYKGITAKGSIPSLHV